MLFYITPSFSQKKVASVVERPALHLVYKPSCNCGSVFYEPFVLNKFLCLTDVIIYKTLVMINSLGIVIEVKRSKDMNHPLQYMAIVRTFFVDFVFKPLHLLNVPKAEFGSR